MKILKELSSYIVVILIVILVRTFIITPVRVNGDSMKPTLNNNEVLLLVKSNKNIKRFDVVVLEFEEERLVKRIIGLPGEHIKYVNNQLFINDSLVSESFLDVETTNFDIKNLGYDVIPENHYFVIGDNRHNSKDGRYFGPVNKESILGKTSLRLYPLNKVGKVK